MVFLIKAGGQMPPAALMFVTQDRPAAIPLPGRAGPALGTGALVAAKLLES